MVLSEHATFNYLCTATYDPQADAAIRWDDADLQERVFETLGMSREEARER